MVYDSKRKLIFIHIPKNAGKSIESSLGLFNAKDRRSAERSLLNLFLKMCLNLTKPSIPLRKLHGSYDYVLCSQHLSILEIKLLGLLSEKEIENSFKFAVCRNPWSRAVSIYNHVHPRLFSGTFKEFCRQWFSDDFQGESAVFKKHNVVAFRRLQSEYIVDRHNQVVIDMLLRFEKLSEDFGKLCDTLDIKDCTLQNFEKLKNPSKSSYHYRDYYDIETKKIIELFFEEDIDRFKYTFEN
jgi:hypothetical protein